MKLILAQCPRCKTRFKVAAEKVAGKKLRCASCRQAFRIPATAASGSAAKKVTSKKPEPAESDEVEIVDDFDGEVELFDEFEENDFPVDEFEDLSEQPVERSSRALPARVSSKPARPGADDAPAAEAKDSGTKKTIILVSAISVAGLLIIGGLIFAGASGKLSFSPKVEAPKEFVDFFPEIGPFNCKYPAGWKVENGGGSGGTPAWARFTKGNSVISIRVGGALSQFLGMGGNQVDPDKIPFELAPVHQAHVAQQQFVEEDFVEYVEKPPQKIETKYGDARRSDFTAKDKLWRGRVAGIRATTANVDTVVIMCRCPEKDFETMRPAFETVINSITAQ